VKKPGISPSECWTMRTKRVQRTRKDHKYRGCYKTITEGNSATVLTVVNNTSKNRSKIHDFYLCGVCYDTLEHMCCDYCAYEEGELARIREQQKEN